MSWWFIDISIRVFKCCFVCSGIVRSVSWQVFESVEVLVMPAKGSTHGLSVAENKRERCMIQSACRGEMRSSEEHSHHIFTSSNGLIREEEVNSFCMQEMAVGR